MTNAQGNRGWAAVMFATILMMLAAATAAPAQTFTTLFSFDGPDGSTPYAGVVQGTDGNFYGTTFQAGSRNRGTVFKITPTGTLTTLYNFCQQTRCADGESPYAGLVQGTDGNFYGTTYMGGAHPYHGTIFKITSSGTLTTVYSFCAQSGCADGASPHAGLLQATDGNFYGTTDGGGANHDGTVFKITTSGILTTLHSFNGTDGAPPYAGLIEDSNGNLYGTTHAGGTAHCGAYTCGTVFKITTTGVLTTLHSFDGYDGSYPVAGLVQATDGNFYGTTGAGGTSGFGAVFKITPTGTLTTLYSFCAQSGCTDGQDPDDLIQATDGNFYGTTYGPANGPIGTIFELTPNGTLTTLHTFDNIGGFGPVGLVQGTNGSFYGTTLGGGNFGAGVVFNLSVGLGPFVETQPTSGKVGAAVKILGTSLTGTTSVTFNGTAATFTVKSATYISTTVPAGATTGPVEVVTPKSMLTSNVNFRVLP